MEKDENDLRKTILSLTPAGLKMAKGLEGIWEDISSANARLMEENQVDIINALTLLEKALEREDIYTRIKREYVRNRLGNPIEGSASGDSL